MKELLMPLVIFKRTVSFENRYYSAGEKHVLSEEATIALGSLVVRIDEVTTKPMDAPVKTVMKRKKRR